MGIQSDPDERKEKALFRAIDTNNSGVVSKQELFNYLRKKLWLCLEMINHMNKFQYIYKNHQIIVFFMNEEKSGWNKIQCHWIIYLLNHFFDYVLNDIDTIIFIIILETLSVWLKLDHNSASFWGLRRWS